jgi:hypothetical protein
MTSDLRARQAHHVVTGKPIDDLDAAMNDLLDLHAIWDKLIKLEKRNK